ncbi:MAG: hypothetical protein N4A35_13055 [Flavobacteriales bacterium]|jgi:hypothetical protein|nr:hypothetical protein [Flavobacteriales bacterium]
MKKLLIIPFVIFTLGSCASLAKAAAKYWTKKQIKEFVNNCEEKSSRLIGADKAQQYCDCAVDVVAEKYHNYEDVQKASIIEVLKIAKDCKD